MKNILYAINKAVGEALDIPAEHIHNEAVEQGLLLPAVFVTVVDVDREAMLGEKSKQRLNFVIDYLDDTSNYADLLELVDVIHRAVYCIALADGSLKKAKVLTWEITQENVLQTHVAYDVITDIKESAEKVESLTTDITKE